MANITQEDIDAVRTFAQQWRGVLAVSDALAGVVDIVQHEQDLATAATNAQSELSRIEAAIAASVGELTKAQQDVDAAIAAKKMVESDVAAKEAECRNRVTQTDTECAQREQACAEKLTEINSNIESAREELAIVRRIIASTKADAIAAING